MTQNQELLLLLEERGELGVNSFEPFRNSHRQLPRMVQDLQEEGYEIDSLPQRNKSTTYVLRGRFGSPAIKKEFHYHFIDNVAIKVLATEYSCAQCNPKPVQEVLNG